MQDRKVRLDAALEAAAQSLLARDGVAGVLLVDELDAPLVQVGDAPAELGASARAAIGTSRLPALLRDGRRQILVREVAAGLRLLVCLDETSRPGLTDRLTGPAAETMAHILAPLLDTARREGR